MAPAIDTAKRRVCMLSSLWFSTLWAMISSFPLVGVPQTRDYDESLAYLAAIYSSAAYSAEGVIANWSFVNADCQEQTQRFEDVTVYNAPGTTALAFVGVDHEARAIIAAFKGTSDLRDWITDLSTWVRYPRECVMPPLKNDTSSEDTEADFSSSALSYQQQLDGRGDDGEEASFGGTLSAVEVEDGDERQKEKDKKKKDGVALGQVHHGFCEYYQSVAEIGMPDRAAELLEAFPEYSLLCTGHSLGGAAATVAAVDFSKRYGIARDRIILYTLGAPRTGDSPFARELTKGIGTAYRLVHRRDIVPHLAPCCHTWKAKCQEGKGCPYHHTEQVWYPGSMDRGGINGSVAANYTLCDGDEGEDDDCAYAVDLSAVDHMYYFEVRIGGYCDMNKSSAAEMEVSWRQAQREAFEIEASLPPQVLRRQPPADHAFGRPLPPPRPPLRSWAATSRR